MTIKQMQPSTRGSNDRRTIRFLVTANDDNDALDQIAFPGALPNGAPAFYDDLVKQDANVIPLSELEREWFPGDGTKRLYQVDALYSLNSISTISQKTNSTPAPLDTELTEEDDPDKELFSFDVSVEEVLETHPDNVPNQAIGFEVGEKTPGVDYQFLPLNGFNYDPKYGFRGINVLRPRGSFTLDIRPDDSKVTRTYQKKVMDMVGSVNQGVFRGYPAGEVLMMSARGESRNNSDWQFAFTYAIRKTRTNVDLGNNVKFAAPIQGWDYIDPWYVVQTAVVGGQKLANLVCRQAIVWRIYPRADLGSIVI